MNTPRNERPLSGLAADLLQDVVKVLRSEVALLKAELRNSLSRLERGIGMILSGALVALCALLVLVESLVVALANVWPPAVAALVVGAVLAAVAMLLMWMGRRDLRLRQLAPERSMRQAESGHRNRENA